MMTVSNLLSFSRAPLAFFFLQESPLLRCCAVLGAMVTDSMDGYWARKTRSSSFFGAILDPLMDKFFVYFALTIFFLEGRLLSWELLATCARDIALFFYGTYRWLKGTLRSLSVQAIVWGKLFTVVQFAILMGLSMGATLPMSLYILLFGMGGFAWIELWKRGDTCLYKHGK